MIASARRMPARGVVQSAHMPAPVGGLNTVSAGSAMPAQDCVALYNLIAAEYGLRSRLGYRSWYQTLTGGSIGASFWAASTVYALGAKVVNAGQLYNCITAGTSDTPLGPYTTADDIIDGTVHWQWLEAVDSSVRSILPFSAAETYRNKLFAATSQGIYDVTDRNTSASSAVQPAPVLSFADPTGDAGWCVPHVVVTSAGHFLAVADEQNGLHYYSSSSNTWAAVTNGTTLAWPASTSVIIGVKVTNGGNEYRCTTAGTTASSGGPTGTDTTTAVTDGTAAWLYVGAAASSVIGASLADQVAGLTFDAARIAFVTVWKGRLLMVEKETARAWYLSVNSIYGTATSFNFAGKFRQGGYLVGLWSWTIDGGSGVDDRLVGVSSGGDVVVYAGDSPAVAVLAGAWYIGAPVSGRQIASPFGGDLLILSTVGIIPLSVLVSGQPNPERQYPTAKIANLYQKLATRARYLRGWSIRLHPEDNALLVTVPTTLGAATNQLAMSLAAKSWSEYRDLPIYSCEVFDGKMYFGTVSGTVKVNEDWTDDGTAIDYRLITAFQNFGNSRQKQIVDVRPLIRSEGGATIGRAVAARYDYDDTDPSAQSATASTGWGNVLWDTATWGAELSTDYRHSGATGMGPNAAVALRGAANARTIVVGFDVSWREGGPL